MDVMDADELYETDTIFSEDEASNLDRRLLELKSDASCEEEFDDNEQDDLSFHDDDSNHLDKIVEEEEEEKMDTADSVGAEDVDNDIRQTTESLFDLSFLDKSTRFRGFQKAEHVDDEENFEEKFRCGRITNGLSYNILTGKLHPNEPEKSSDNDTYPLGSPSTNANSSDVFCGFPRSFHFGDKLIEPDAVWTLKYMESELEMLTTFELQASICAALNSRHFLLLCIGVDENDSVTGCSMSARDRVTFRLALLRAVTAEFQPPLVSVSPAILNGIAAADDVSAISSLVDVVYVPVFNCPNPSTAQRYLIVVRVKERTEKVYQLSSGRIYIEEGGVPVQLSCLEEATRLLLSDNRGEDSTVFEKIESEEVKCAPNTCKRVVKQRHFKPWKHLSMGAVIASFVAFGALRVYKKLI